MASMKTVRPAYRTANFFDSTLLNAKEHFEVRKHTKVLVGASFSTTKNFMI